MGVKRFWERIGKLLERFAPGALGHQKDRTLLTSHRKRGFLPKLGGISVSLLLLFCTSWPVHLAGCGKEPQESMDTPRVDGGIIRGENLEGVRVYKGIPYAAPPVGDLRWKEPRPPSPWEGIRDCVEYGPSCPQPTGGWEDYLKVGKTDEDCLYLNVWSPASHPSDRLPVMVWIHGGAFRSGSGSLRLYDGANLARRGVVVVTINYRLGPLGFMAHPCLSKESPWGASGNYGLLDQLAALSWVNRNIRAFGGDPSNITVFGESAGAMSILFLMTSPLSTGLFHRAVVESGPLPDLGLPTLQMLTLEEAERKGMELAKKLGVDWKGSGDDQYVLGRLRAIPTDDIMRALSDFESLSVIDFGPILDGHVLPQKPVQAFARGAHHQMPLIIGVNADEGTMFAPEIDLEKYKLIVSLGYGSLGDRVLSLFPAASHGEVGNALSRLITQMGFSASARFIADSCSAMGSPVYLYLFQRVPEDLKARHLGAFHGLEIIYVFNNLHLAGEFFAHEEDVRLSSTMAEYWVNFASKGDPNREGLPSWPSYSPEEPWHLNLGDEISTAMDLHGEAYRLVRQFKGY